jgi:LacI family transcriptional regulator
VVAQDPAAMGRTAAELLFDRIGGSTRPPEVRLVPTTLIRRGSGEIAPPV